MRIVGYCRVSDKEQATKGYSIEAQEETITAWCDDNHHQLVRVYIEPGRSGSKPSETTRPTFEHAVNVVLAGVADSLVVKWMDRFARNVEDFLRVRSQFYQAGKNLISISEPLLNGDPGDPTARYIAVAIMNAYQLQAELTGVKSKEGRIRRAKQGFYPGTVPTGYARNEQKNIIIDPELGPMMETAFREFSTGRYTLDEWTKEARNRGYKTRRGGKIAKSVWYHAFRNRFYIGWFTWSGQEYLGDYDPLIDQHTFEAVQEILDEHGSGQIIQRNFWLLSGLLWSEVHNSLMSGSLVKGQYTYYRATAPGLPEHNLKADELHERVTDYLSHIKWDGERVYTIPEKWRLAVKMAENMKQPFALLETEDEKREFLKMIFLNRGIHVAESGRVEKVDLLPGFALFLEPIVRV